MSTWTPSLIPRKVFTAYRRSITVNDYGRTTTTTTNFSVKNASVQPLNGREQQALAEGFRDKNVYKLFTTTKVQATKEGTGQIADRIIITVLDETITTEVIKVAAYGAGVQEHYEALLVEVNER